MRKILKRCEGEYSEEQQMILRRGKLYNVNLDRLVDNTFTPEQMLLILHIAALGFNPTLVCDTSLDENIITKVGFFLEAFVPERILHKTGKFYERTWRQIYAIKYALKQGMPIQILENPELSEAQIGVMTDAYIVGFNMVPYLMPVEDVSALKTKFAEDLALEADYVNMETWRYYNIRFAELHRYYDIVDALAYRSRFACASLIRACTVCVFDRSMLSIEDDDKLFERVQLCEKNRKLYQRLNRISEVSAYI